MSNLPTKLIEHLKRKSLTLTTVESCTGGAIATAITSVAGASSVFDRGFITYSNEAKIEMLGVSPETLESYGAVSAQTAEEMAQGALKNSNADITISVTGIAGPDGGTDEKPVGLVYFGLAQTGSKTQSFQHIFTGSRNDIQLKAVEFALKHLIDAMNQP